MKARVVFTTVFLLGYAYGGTWPWPWHRSKVKQNASTVATATASTAGTTGSDIPTSQPQEANYIIAVNDVLRIAVWQEPALSATVPVRTDGKISVPLLHDVQACGLTPLELTTTLTEKFKKYL